MDISKITDIKELKAMVYDELSARQNAENNIQALNARIAELSRAEAPPED